MTKKKDNERAKAGSGKRHDKHAKKEKGVRHDKHAPTSPAAVPETE